MTHLTITCPHCAYSRELPADSVPQRPLRVTCPQCRNVFPYVKPVPQEPVSARPSPDIHPPLEPLAALLPPEPAESGGEDVTSPQPAPPKASTPGELRGIGALFASAWEIYLRRVGVLMGLYLLSIAFLVVPLGLGALIGFGLAVDIPALHLPLIVAGALTGLAVGGLAIFWGLTALVLAVADERLGIPAALRQGWERMWSYIWVFTLTGFIVTGGFLLFFIPGALFSVWFFLAQYVFAAEDEKGMRALLKSKAYMRGRFWPVALRLLAVWAVSVLLGLIPMLGWLLSLLFVPFLMIYGWLLYVDLRPGEEAPAFSCTVGEKARWLFIAMAGYLVIPLLFLLTAASFLARLFSGMPRPWQGVNILLPFWNNLF